MNYTNKQQEIVRSILERTKGNFVNLSNCCKICKSLQNEPVNLVTQKANVRRIDTTYSEKAF